MGVGDGNILPLSMYGGEKDLADGTRSIFKKHLKWVAKIFSIWYDEPWRMAVTETGEYHEV